MKKEDFKHWKETRKKGIVRYVTINGMVAWGIPMFIVMCFVVNKPFAQGFTVANVSLNVSLYLLGGAIFGLMTWYTQERAFKKTCQTRIFDN